MKLDSVRELKLSLAEKLIPKIASHINALSAFGRSASAMESVSAPPSTVALGVAPDGKKGFKLAVRVQKRAFEDSKEVELITKQAKGEVEVRYVGRISKRATPWYQARQRPLLIGCSVGHYEITAGTLGCFVRIKKDGTLCMLSNNHVLANENAGKKGDDVLQPGRYDKGKRPADVVAKLQDFVKIKTTGKNFVDCAIAALKPGIKFDSTKLRGLGKLAGIGDAFLDEGTKVAKVGRTTGVTLGRVTAFELDNVVVAFDIGKIRFDDQIEIEGAGTKPFSDGGDSGSLIVNADFKGVGLLFAGGDQGGSNGQGLTYANPLATVLKALKVELAL